MGIAPSNTLSPNTAETRSQQDHWLCELSLVVPARPRRSRPIGTARARRQARPVWVPWPGGTEAGVLPGAGAAHGAGVATGERGPARPRCRAG